VEAEINGGTSDDRTIFYSLPPFFHKGVHTSSSRLSLVKFIQLV
jgi:hypothetical protein